jgi:circadian clock protein KaiC
LLDDLTGTAADGHLQSLAHGVLTLDKLVPLYGAQRRRLRVAKLRGVDFRGGYHDFVIERGGVVIFPRLVASEHKNDFERGVASSGMPQLDAMLGGGLDRGTSALLLGPPGTGKSALATQWASAAAARGEKVFVYAFDESVATMEARSRSLGIDLPAHEKAGRIIVRQIDPAEVPPGQLTHQIRQAVEAEGARMVIIDSLNGYLQAMPDESFLVLQLHELLTYLGRRGVVSLLVVAQNGLLGASMVSPTDVTYLADTVLLLRHFEAGGTLRKAVSILKKRTGKHESAIRELRLSAEGITAGEPLTNFRGVLTGVPTYEGSPGTLQPGGVRGGNV